MNLYFFPILLGLLGFVQPCTMGLNAIFLANIRPLDRAGRVWAAMTLLASRSAFLSVLGLLAGYLGHYLTIKIKMLGIPYLVLGGVFIASRFKAFPVPNFSIQRLDGSKRRWIPVGVSLGLSIPSCVSPLLVALLLLSAHAGSTVSGFILLLLFGTALSLPLLGISYSNDGRDILRKVYTLVNVSPVIAGLIMISAGLYLLA